MRKVLVLFAGEQPYLEFVDVTDESGREVAVGEWRTVTFEDATYQALALDVREKEGGA